ncbi:MAG: rhodanese-like domain-containing protein [Spirochaetales bacterium]
MYRTHRLSLTLVLYTACCLLVAFPLAAQEVKPAPLSDYETLALALKNGTVKNLLVVDIRSRELYKQGHIPKAINLPLDELWDKVPGKAGIQPVLVVYGKPASSDVRKAVDILLSNGFTNVIAFGSISLWKGPLE